MRNTRKSTPVVRNEVIDRLVAEGMGILQSHLELHVECTTEMNKPKAAPWIDGRCNPITGCTKCSPGCKNCWAHGVNKRFGDDEDFPVTLHPERLMHVLKMKKPGHIAMCLMSDIFHQDVTQHMLECVIQAMAAVPRHTYFLLTRRPENGIAAISKLAPEYKAVLERCWIGVSAENQEYFDKRTPFLKYLPGHKFVSCEPLLGPIENIATANAEWIIAGPESGPKRRKFADIDIWINSIVAQCQNIGVPVVDKRKHGKSICQQRPCTDVTRGARLCA